MTMQQPQNDQGRPLTRRELRELAERQAQSAASAAASAQPSPFGALNSPAPGQALGAAFSAGPTPAAPASNSVPFGTPLQSGSTQSTAVVAPATPAAPARQSVSQFPTQGSFGAPLSASAGVPARPATPEFARFEQAPAPASPTLQPRPVAAPEREPVQLTRRSMYQAPAAPAVPQVTPPAQAGAVRVLEETGTISKLVDPATFDPSNTAVAPAVANPSLTPPVGRANLSEFMRQAPPSSQIPRVIQDERGNWAAADPASVQRQFENNATMLPSWGHNNVPFDAQALAGSQPSFVPELGNGQASLPSRVSSLPRQALQPQSVQSPSPQALFDQAPAHLPNVAQPEPAPAVAAQRSSDITDQPTAPFQMPEWDAITSVDSHLPQDPTRGGVSVSQLTGEIEPVRASITTRSNAPLGGGLAAAMGQNAASEQRPISSFGEDTQQNEPTIRANGAAFPGFGANKAPSLGTPVPGGLTSRLHNDLDEDEEEFELDHSYTWLHYLILVAVAFVLGMVIWMVGINPDRHDSSTQDSTSSSVILDPGVQQIEIS